MYTNFPCVDKPLAGLFQWLLESLPLTHTQRWFKRSGLLHPAGSSKVSSLAAPHKPHSPGQFFILAQDRCPLCLPSFVFKEWPTAVSQAGPFFFFKEGKEVVKATHPTQDITVTGTLGPKLLCLISSFNALPSLRLCISRLSRYHRTSALTAPPRPSTCSLIITCVTRCVVRKRLQWERQLISAGQCTASSVLTPHPFYLHVWILFPGNCFS